MPSHKRNVANTKSWMLNRRCRVVNAGAEMTTRKCRILNGSVPDAKAWPDETSNRVAARVVILTQQCAIKKQTNDGCATESYLVELFEAGIKRLNGMDVKLNLTAPMLSLRKHDCNTDNYGNGGYAWWNI